MNCKSPVKKIKNWEITLLINIYEQRNSKEKKNKPRINFLLFRIKISIPSYSAIQYRNIILCFRRYLYLRNNFIQQMQLLEPAQRCIYSSVNNPSDTE